MPFHWLLLLPSQAFPVLGTARTSRNTGTLRLPGSWHSSQCLPTANISARRCCWGAPQMQGSDWLARSANQATLVVVCWIPLGSWWGHQNTLGKGSLESSSCDEKRNNGSTNSITTWNKMQQVVCISCTTCGFCVHNGIGCFSWVHQSDHKLNVRHPKSQAHFISGAKSLQRTPMEASTPQGHRLPSTHWVVPDYFFQPTWILLLYLPKQILKHIEISLLCSYNVHIQTCKTVTIYNMGNLQISVLVVHTVFRSQIWWPALNNPPQLT